MPNFQIYTMYVNGPELLNHALTSLGDWQKYAVVLDNSPLQNLDLPGFDGEIVRPSVPLFCSQSYNFILSLAKQRKQDLFFIMHSDAEASAEVIEEMLHRAADLDRKKRRWGVMFSNYDVLCLHNTAVLADFRWDPNFPVYFTDVDFYRRLKLSGIELVETGLPVRHMNGGSSSIQQDPQLNHFVQINYASWHRYYFAKWGGERDHETFDTPFNMGDLGMLRG